MASDATAFPHRGDGYSIHIFPGWVDPSADDAVMGWARGFGDAVAGHANGGVYVNMLAEDEGTRIAAAYGDNFSRLAEVKAKWDPENVFRMNHNVPPKAD